MHKQGGVSINKVAKNFFSIGASNIISQLLLFLVGTYYARILGKDFFGNLSVVQQIMTYFTMLTLFGLQTYGMREVSKDSAGMHTTAGNILTLRLIISLLCYAVIFIIGMLMMKQDRVFAVLLILYGLTLIPSAINMDWIFMGLQDMQHNAVYNILKNLILFILVFMFIRGPQNVFLIPVFLLIGLTAASIYQFYVFFIKKKLKIGFSLDTSKGKGLMKLGLPFLVSGILAMINCNVDGIIIAFSRSKGEAGLYGSAYYIILFLTNIVTIIFTPVFPVLIRLYHESDYGRLGKTIESLAKVIVMIAVPLLIGGIILSDDIILLLFGGEYLQSHVPFRILMVYAFLLFMREIYGYGLNAWNREKEYLRIVGLSSGINLVFNLIFTPVFGMNIAALITVFSELINLVLMRKAARNIVKFQYAGYIIKAILPGGLMACIIIFMKILNMHVLFTISAGALAYAVSILASKYITKEEIRDFIMKK